MWDKFFYYDSVSVEDMNKSDLNEILTQPEKTLYYFRSFGVDMKQNYPLSGFNSLLVAYSIANAVAKRNQSVTDGSDGFQDRRIAVSQSFINVKDRSTGERDINVYYFNYKGYETPQITTVVVK